MAVPKAAMDKYNFPGSSKDKIGFAGKIGGVKPESVAHAMNQAANRDFGLAILAADATHPLAALFWREGYRPCEEARLPLAPEAL